MLHLASAAGVTHLLSTAQGHLGPIVLALIRKERRVHLGSATRNIAGNLVMITLAIGVIKKAPLAKSYRKVSLA